VAFLAYLPDWGRLSQEINATFAGHIFMLARGKAGVAFIFIQGWET
jgi:hypothetical protein